MRLDKAGGTKGCVLPGPASVQKMLVILILLSHKEGIFELRSEGIVGVF